jgi:hypothetical protein
LDGAFSDVVIGDELEEILVVIVDGLISDDPVWCVKIGDILVVGLGFRNLPSRRACQCGWLLSHLKDLRDGRSMMRLRPDQRELIKKALCSYLKVKFQLYGTEINLIKFYFCLIFMLYKIIWN